MRKLFDVVFQEAHVIDVDFSKWDKRIRLVVVGGLVGDNFDGRGPLHNVDFSGVKSFTLHANHLDVEPESEDTHCQWVIMEFSVHSEGAFSRVTLSGFGPTPLLVIVCRAVTISELNPDFVAKVNPLWNRASAPLARPSLDELIAARIRN
jgi:hypothetical protein